MHGLCITQRRGNDAIIDRTEWRIAGSTPETCGREKRIFDHGMVVRDSNGADLVELQYDADPHAIGGGYDDGKTVFKRM